MGYEQSGVRRVKLPDTRSGETRKTVVGSWELYITVNFFSNDQPGEVFIVVGKNGTTVSGLMQTIATQFSMLLQVGVPVIRVCDKMTHHRFDPSDHVYCSLVDALSTTVLNICSERGSLADLDYDKKKVKW